MSVIVGVKHLILPLILLAVLAVGCEKAAVVNDIPQQSSVALDRVYRPLIHHFSSTDCGPCGRFGIPVIETVAEQMGDSVFPFITHFKYNDPFKTASSAAIEQAILNQWHSPQIWINNTEITFDILGMSVSNASTETKRRLREKMTNTAEAYIGVEAEIREDQRYDVSFALENNTTGTASFYIEIYGMEDSLVAAQAGANPYHKAHLMVNRGGHFGGMGKEVTLNAGGLHEESIEYIPCWGCIPEDVYFNVVVWKKLPSGKFQYVNGKILR